MRRAALCLAAAAVAAAAVVAAAAAGPAPAPADPFAPVFDAPTNRGLKPERLYVFDRWHYYQVPEEPVGTLVIFHGCGRSSKAFFPWHPVDCPECLGFPEHVAQTKQALAMGYAVLALDPQDARHLCWSSANRGYFVNDQPKVIELIRIFIGAQGLADRPILLLGVSSGGTLALKLAAALEVEAERRAAAAREGAQPEEGEEWVPRISGIIVEEAVPTDFNAGDADGKLRLPGFPPTIFVLMEGGNARLDAPQVVEFLREGGVPADVVMSPRRRVGPTFLSDRIPAITQLQSRLIQEAMRGIGMLDVEGWLLGDPERNRIVRRNTTSPAFDWDVKLKAALPWLADASPTLSLVYRSCGIQQALNVAYARHDAVADYVTVALKWLEARGTADLDGLLERYTVKQYNLTALTADRMVEGGSAPGGAPAPEALPVPAPAPEPSLPRRRS